MDEDSRWWLRFWSFPFSALAFCLLICGVGGNVVYGALYPSRFDGNNWAGILVCISLTIVLLSFAAAFWFGSSDFEREKEAKTPSEHRTLKTAGLIALIAFSCAAPQCIGWLISFFHAHK